MDPNAEYALLSPEEQAIIDKIRDRFKDRAIMGYISEYLTNGREAYAYRSGDSVHWGINGSDGYCTARGVFT